MEQRSFLAPSAIVLILLSLPPEGTAQRKSQLGTSVDLIGGVSNRPGYGGFGSSLMLQDMVGFATVYPSVTFRSQSPRSILDLNYGFLWERYMLDPTLDMSAHTLGAIVDFKISRRARLRLADAFYNAPTLSGLGVLRPDAPASEGFTYAFDPLTIKRYTMNNAARASLGIDLGPRSKADIALSMADRRYENADSLNSPLLPDQRRLEGNLAYSYSLTPRQTWRSRYLFYENRLQGYQAARTHIAAMGYEHQTRSSLRVGVDAGPAYVGRTGSHKTYFGYYLSADLSKEIRRNRINLYYQHRPGDSTGIGAVSDSDRAGAGFARLFGEATFLNINAQAFRQVRRGVSAAEYRGWSGSAALSRALGSHWVASVGGSYQRYVGGTGLPGMKYQRVFAAIGFRLPGIAASSAQGPSR